MFSTLVTYPPIKSRTLTYSRSFSNTEIWPWFKTEHYLKLGSVQGVQEFYYKAVTILTIFQRNINLMIFAVADILNYLTNAHIIGTYYSR